MSKQTLPYHETGYFSKLMCDYLAQKDSTLNFFGRFPAIENFKAQLEEKQQSFSKASRVVLNEQLLDQYGDMAISEATKSNIDSILSEETFTVTTGHQLNLFSGPLYFLYKIFSVINLTEQLAKKYPKQRFVPVYWMATEDHDFDEINYFNSGGKKIVWNRQSSGAVGELSTESLKSLEEDIATLFGRSDHAKRLISLFSEAYVKSKNLAEATRFLANELFAAYGLVIVDGNDIALKKAFIPYVERDLFDHLSHNEVTTTTALLLDEGYDEQVHPREINLFYLIENTRERIIERDGRFYINETDLSFSSEEIKDELKNHPERFSPNALLRPLFQEVILPNICYVGGGGELAYWFQLKDYFNRVDVPFPILLLRNSALLIPHKYTVKLNKLEVEIPDLFLKQTELQKKYTKQLSTIKIDFKTQRTHLKEQFKALYDLAEKTDASFVGAVAAQEKKQLNGLDHLEKRLLTAQKRKYSEQIEKLLAIQDELFPNQSLQERFINFSEFYLEYGDDLLVQIKKHLDPLEHQFTIITL